MMPDDTIDWRARAEHAEAEVARLRSLINEHRGHIPPDSIIAIRQRVANGELHSTVGKDYELHSRTIGAIARGVMYKHVGGPRTFRGKGWSKKARHLRQNDP